MTKIEAKRRASRRELIFKPSSWSCLGFALGAPKF